VCCWSARQFARARKAALRLAHHALQMSYLAATRVALAREARVAQGAWNEGKMRACMHAGTVHSQTSVWKLLRIML